MKTMIKYDNDCFKKKSQCRVLTYRVPAECRFSYYYLGYYYLGYYTRKHITYLGITD